MRRRPSSFPSRRSTLVARSAMVATSQPLAAQAGLQIMREGGNAADAAVTVAAMLNIVEPMSTGIGGDCFALIYEASSTQVTALNGSGRAPAAFTLQEAQKRKLTELPLLGPLPVTVPGTAAGWADLLERFGTMSLAECLAPAIATAEHGFPVSERISAGWQRSTDKLSLDPEAARVYLPAPRPGEVHRQPDLAQTFRLVAEGGARAFYEGPLATRIAARVQELGGFLTAADLAAHRSTWEEPIRTGYRGIQILEHPPNGQGLAALVTLSVLEGFDLAAMSYYDPGRWHIVIEAMRLGMADAAQFVADPAFAQVPVQELLSREYASRRRSQIKPGRSLELVAPGVPEHQDTVYLTVVDTRGNAVSFINSLFYGFGSGIVVPGTGVCLQNRGACFSLEPGHPNALVPGKRPYHTIIPAMALRNGRLWLSFGVMGGYMQPQGHVQVVVNLVDYGLAPQAALDAPRFRVDQRGGPGVAIERSVPRKTRKALAAFGHPLSVENLFAPGFGSGDIIAVDPETGILSGASDPRKDGYPVGF